VRTTGDDLLASVEPAHDVAIVVDGRVDAPAAGVSGRPVRAQVDDAAGLFGLLLDAGIDPAVVDLDGLAPGALDRYALVLFPDPDVVHQDAAAVLDDYVRRGGTLVNLLNPGRYDEAWRRGTRTEALLAGGLFSDGTPTGVFDNTLLAEAHVNLRAPGGPSGALPVGPFLGKWQVGPGATPILWDRTFPLGQDGDVVGWTAPRGAGTVVFLGTNPAARWESAAYFETSGQDVVLARDLVRWLARGAGARGPVVSVRGGAGTAWARVVPGRGAVLFVQGRLGAAATVHLDVGDLAPLGLVAGATYSVEEREGGATLAGAITGADLAARGLDVPLAPFGTAVLRIR
jgi:hypothetical protein